MGSQMVRSFSILICGLLFLTACHNGVETTADSNKLIAAWNDAHNKKDIKALTTMYADGVLYYGEQTDRATCIASKKELFKKYAYYQQELAGDITSENTGDTELTCTFTKRVNFNGQQRSFPSYVKFAKRQETWQIVIEGDKVTDQNRAKKANEVPTPTKEDSVKGDFNGDGKLETAWLVPPEILENDSCPGGCNSLIKFSDPSIPPITVERCIGGHPDNLGDLNKNGTDELGISTEWFQGCWNSYNPYTLKNGKWIYAVEPFSTHCNQWEEGVVPIEIDKKKPGHVLIRYSQSTDEAIVVKTKSVPVK